MVKVEILQDFADDAGTEYKAGDIVEVDQETADAWIEAGAGKLVEETAEASKGRKKLTLSAPKKSLDNAVGHALADSETRLSSKIKSLEGEIKSLREMRNFAQPKEKGNFNEWMWNVAKLLHNGTSPNEKQAAWDIVSNKYDTKYANPEKPGEALRTKATAVTYVGSNMGYLVPEEFNFDKDDDNPDDFIRQLADVVPTSLPVVPFTRFKNTGSAASTNDHPSDSGIVLAYDNEDAAAQLTGANVEQYKLSVNKLAGYIPVSRLLLETSAVSLDSELRKKFTDAVTRRMQRDFIFGNGVSKPRGFANSAAAVSVSRGTASHFTAPDVFGMLNKLPGGARNDKSTVWIMSRSALVDCYSLKDDEGNSMWVPNYRDKEGDMLMGHRIYVSDYSPVVASAKSVILAQLSQYKIVELGTPMISLSEHVQFIQGNVLFKVEHFFDGQSKWAETRILPDGSSTAVSPFVYLT